MRKMWFSTSEAAEYLGGFTDRFVRRQIELGRLRSQVFDAGGRPTHRIHRDDLDAFRRQYFRWTGRPDR